MKAFFRRVPYLIAEAGVNHNGDLSLALRLIDAAARSGADAVKFQTFQAELLATAAAPKARYQRLKTNGRESQLAMLKRLELSPRDHEILIARCRKLRLEFLSTPFDAPSADLLERLGVRMFKIPSGEITHAALLCHIARKGRPVLLSTGMSSLAEVAQAVRIIRDNGNPPLALLHCVSSYPANPADANLRAMQTMARRFGLSVGFSDHTPGLEVAVAAAALGAAVIEKHFTLDKRLPGPDHAMSLEPDELREFVRAVRSAVSALGDGRKEPRPSEAEIRRVARRSLVLACDASAGEKLTLDMLAAKRPGTGIPPTQAASVLGRRLRRAAVQDTLLRREMLR